MILNMHYAKRMPSVSYSYGLFNCDMLVGVLTIGKPASNALCVGICGEDYKSKVYELNRLITVEGLPKNTLSFFVGKVLRDLKEEDLILVSYADSGMDHCGYIYQATNWIFTGKTKSRTDKYTVGGAHSRRYGNEHNHLRKFRTSKYRYVFFTGKSRKKYLKIMNYKIEDYPKEENKNYKLGDSLKVKIINRDTGEEWFE